MLERRRHNKILYFEIKKYSNAFAYKTNTWKSIAFIQDSIYNSNKNNKTPINKFTKKVCRLLLGEKAYKAGIKNIKQDFSK